MVYHDLDSGISLPISKLKLWPMLMNTPINLNGTVILEYGMVFVLKTLITSFSKS